jgi:uncharacterized membrane protein YdjX (TVP38/TMEM64 family)
MTAKHRHTSVVARSAPDEERRGLKGGVLLCICLAAAIALAAVAFFLEWGPNLTIDEFVETIRSWGMWGVFGSIALMMIHSFVPFPAELLACANGMIYGPLWGTVITWTGAMLGAAIAFGLARKLGRPFVERMVARRNWDVLDDWAAVNGWQVVLISRFIPVIAFNLINYAAGLTRLTWWQFLWTTGLGILPLTFLMVVMGDNIQSLGWESWLALLVGGLVLWIIFRRKLERRPLVPTSEESD